MIEKKLFKYVDDEEYDMKRIQVINMKHDIAKIRSNSIFKWNNFTHNHSAICKVTWRHLVLHVKT